MRPPAHAAQVPHEIWNGTTTTIARRHAAHGVADVDHLGDALVPERERRFDAEHAGQQGRVEIAHRHGQRPHERLAVTLERGRRHVAPAHRAQPRDLELPHAYVGASRNGMTAGASSGDMKTS